MKNVVLGNGKVVHQPYLSKDGERVFGSLCNPYAWETVRVRYIDAPATCKRCAVASHRADEQKDVK